MLYDPSTAAHLKPWLVRSLEPICDAEPGALADYVLALLKHNVPESDMRKELTVQLDEFLEKEGPAFVDTLFTVLRTKSYLPYTDTPPTQPAFPPSFNRPSSDVGIPIPLDGLLQRPPLDRGQKRTLEYDAVDPHAQHPAKGPRLSSDEQFSRYSEVREGRAWGERSDLQEMGNVHCQRIQTYQPPDRRGVCRDYHKNGYCARGVLCKYSHGDDAFVPSQLFPMNGPGPIPFMPMFPNGALPFAMAGPGAAYDPQESRMDMRPNGGMMGMNGRSHHRPPLMSRTQQDDGIQATGELPVIQDLTPQDAAADAGLRPAQDGLQGIPTQLQGGDVEMETSVAGPSTHDSRCVSARGRGGQRGRGTFSADAQSFRPERRSDKTLVVEKIPQDKLSLDAVNGWFKRFGTVTNVAIDVHGAKALVSFSEHHEALAAWKAEDAVFNNRFVKVYWHRPVGGHGQKGARMLAASASLVASISGRPSATSHPVPLTTSTTAEVPPSVPAPASPHTTTPTPAPTPAPAPAPAARKPPASTATSDLAAKQKLLEQRIAEQKSLMAALTTASGEEKKNIMTRLRKLGEEMQAPSTPAAASAARHSPAPSAGRAASTAPQASDHDKEKERLDKELEFHNAVSAGESTEELHAKLARLREEAASLGISDHSYGAGAPGSHRAWRGRGRGGRSGFFRGAARGGPPRSSMKLDNRPRRLLVKGVGADAIPAIRGWYETAGQLESVEVQDGSNAVVVAFRTRAAAEQALASGNDVPSVGTVQIVWHTGQQQSSVAGAQRPAVPSAHAVHADGGARDGRRGMSPPPPPRPQEEEVAASGWGDGDEDGMGF